MRRATIGLLFLLATVSLTAQSKKDSKGKDFWVAFMPNAHTQTVGTLIVYITAEQATTGSYSYVNRSGRTVSAPFTIAQANSEFRVTIPYGELELIGCNYNTRRRNDEETAVPYTLHIVANQEVTVYAEAREETSTDAWLALPTDVLGTDYLVLCYPSDGAYGRITLFSNGITQEYPSQFCVIATQNDTRVTITNAAGRSPSGTWSEKTVTLQAGQVYLVQAEIARTILNDDLTGSRVRATKPVAVIAGVVRTELPRIDANNASRDCLIEQMPPISTWGLSSIIVPPQSAKDERLIGSNDGPLFRILASENATNIVINGTQRVVLAAGQMFEGVLAETKVISSDKPILVASYLRTSQRSGTATGDPSMFLNPPTEQFLNSYTVINIEPDAVSPYYVEHIITAIVQDSSADSLFVDGVQTSATFNPIPGSIYRYAHLNVQRGPHTLWCPTGFGVFVYGYGRAESYGYIGGMAFDRLRIPRVRLVVHDTSGAAGDSAGIVVTYDGVSDSAAFSVLGIRTMVGELSWNATQFIPVELNGRRTMIDTLFLPVVVNFDTLIVGDTLLRIPGRIVLGNAALDSVYLRGVAWYDASGDSLEVETEVDNGAITNSKICRDTAARLFDPVVAMQPFSIEVVDVVGRSVATFIVNALRDPADIRELLHSLGVPPGCWLVIERRASGNVVHRLVVQE